MMQYVFDPIKYGFRSPDNIPEQIKDYVHRRAYVKVICTWENGTFWYQAIYQPYGKGDDRWESTGGVWGAHSENHSYHNSHVDYLGCITSPEYAELLLAHLLGTTKDEGVFTYGVERLKAPSLEIPEGKEPK